MNSLLDEMVIPLSRPYTIDGVERDSITIREPKLRDRLLYSKDKGVSEERSARMIARLANLDISALHGLPDCDYSKLEDAFNEMVKVPEDRKQIL
ncbi:phage tail assembly protein [Salmonella enterica subsp. enterica serovar Agbeni]|nr:phage tail assembly protein [Salmonella enterica subsp. enterica serovar Agbeni]